MIHDPRHAPQPGDVLATRRETRIVTWVTPQRVGYLLAHGHAERSVTAAEWQRWAAQSEPEAA